MSQNFKPLALEDFGLSKDELQTIVEGSQKFLRPDDEKDTVDTRPPGPTSLTDGNHD